MTKPAISVSPFGSITHDKVVSSHAVSHRLAKKKIMNNAEAKVKDKEVAKNIKDYCSSSDTEINHCMADDMLVGLLVELGYIDTVVAFRNVEKWYA